MKRSYMKVSVSLPRDDADDLDRYARDQGIGSRTAAMHKAVRLLRAAEPGTDYESARDEWADSEDAGAWERTSGDGLTT